MNYQEILGGISERVGGKENCTYYVLIRKKHNRLIAFRDRKKAIEFIEPKFRHSFLKRVYYYFFLDKGYFLNCKKIQLSSKLGDVIYVANQIKSFDLDKEEVYVFEKNKNNFDLRIDLQKELSKNKLAPGILEENPDKLYYKEELLYDGDISFAKILLKIKIFYDLVDNQYIHGDLCMDHVKVDKKGNVRFIDWEVKSGTPKEDLDKLIRSIK